MANEQEATTNLVFRQKESETSPLSTVSVKGTPGKVAAKVNLASDRGETFITFETAAGKQLAIKVARIESIADS